MTNRVGQQLGNYRLLRLLAQRAFYEVYQGEHILLKKQVDIKVPSSSELPSAFIQYHKQEVKFLLSMNHPHIIKILEFNTDDSTPFLVMDYSPNETLSERHPKGVVLPLTTVISYVKQIASALQYIHDKEVIHRNVKPSVMFIGRNNEILLGDFEIALDIALLKEPSANIERAGTPLYMAPEQFEGKPVLASDQYALAIVTYEWLCGSLPFEGNALQLAYQHLKVSLPSLREKNPSIPQDVEDVVMKALAKKPEDRYESVTAFAEALEKAVTTLDNDPAELLLRLLKQAREEARKDRVGQQIENYQLTRVLGDRFTYLAEDITSGNKVVIRLPPLHYISQERFIRQATIFSKLKHPNILSILNYGIANKKDPYFVMEYAPNGSFRDRYPQGIILPITTIIPFVRQIISALQYIWDSASLNNIEGLKHYELNPHNMLLGRNSEILLRGFDDALFRNWDLDSDGTMWVYNPYEAPEAITNPRGWKDQYQYQHTVAIIAYEWFCGVHPSTFTSKKPKEDILDYVLRTRSEPYIPLRAKNPSISQAIEDVVMKALAKNPKDRYESIMAFAEALEQASTAKRTDGIGEQFGQFRTVRLIGQGDIGKVYLAELLLRPNQQNRPFAIKVLHGLHDKEVFLSYARRLTQLQHPNILPIREYGVKDSSPYLLMEYAHQGTLLNRHPRRTPLPLSTILPYVKQIASALQYAHEKGIYGDVRPKKMFSGPNNTILLSGFDLALNKDADPGRKVAKDYFEYRAPEQTQTSCTPACNQYSLGILVYEWLSGDVPFRGESVQIVYQHKRVTPPSLREKNPAILHEVEEVVMKALAKEPERRFESIQDFAEALEEAITSNKADRYVLPDRSGEQFGKYRLVRRLGQGGFAEVYLGQHFKLNTFAAIKVLHTHMSAKELAAFEKEAQFIANLRHPSIVRVLDFDAEGSTPFLVMDHAPEGTMRQFHARGSRLSLPLVVKFVKQIADALQYAHDQKIIHRDVKPENMLIWSRESIMLSDFGLAVIAHSAKSWREQDKAGTAKYMAPEQFRGKAVPASDQYSLAITAYEWLCGLPPFDEGTDIQLGFRHLDEPVSPMSERGAIVSPEVEQVIMKALEKDPLKRFGSVKEFAEALEKAAAQG